MVRIKIFWGWLLQHSLVVARTTSTRPAAEPAASWHRMISHPEVIDLVETGEALGYARIYGVLGAAQLTALPIRVGVRGRPLDGTSLLG